MNLQSIRYKLENLKGQHQRLTVDIDRLVENIDKLKQETVYVEEARAIIQIVAQETQKQLEFHISEICSLALAAVFDNPYALRLVFVQRRNKTEADIVFERDGQQYRPIDASGGGAVDIAAFALRVAMWSLRRPRPRGTLILDEPFKMLSRDRMPRAAAMIAEVSRRLGLQMIMVSHSTELIEGADRYFTVTMHKGVSHVTAGTATGTDGKEYAENDKAVVKDGLLPAPRRATDLQDTGDSLSKQSGVDGSAATHHAPRARRGEGAAPRDHGERQESERVDRTPRRRRT